MVASGHRLSGVAGLVALADSTAVAAYEKCFGRLPECTNRVFVKRSTDGGRSWGVRLGIGGANAEMAAVAGLGTDVDLVWQDGDGGVRYARSANAGVSFGRPRLLSPWGTEPSVARGPNGLVAIGWGGDDASGQPRYSVGVSTDGGRTFGSKTSWETSVLWAPERSAVAVGDGVVYVAYIAADAPFEAGGPLLLRRSRDAGATWSKAWKLEESGGRSDSDDRSGPSISAEGSDAYIAYSITDGLGQFQVLYSRTRNSGRTWSTPAPLSADPSDNPQISIRDGVVSAVFRRLTDTSVEGLYRGQLVYRRSSDGINWTAPDPISTSDRLRIARGLGSIENAILVLYLDAQGVLARTCAHPACE